MLLDETKIVTEEIYDTSELNTGIYETYFLPDHFYDRHYGQT